MGARRCTVLLFLATLLPGPANGQPRVVLTVSKDDWRQLDGDSYASDLSPDGRYRVFLSEASSLAGCAGTPHGGNAPRGSELRHVYVSDSVVGGIECVSKSSSGTPGNGRSDRAAISADGNIVAFVSASTNLVSPATANLQIFVRNRAAGTTVLVSVAPDGTTPANADSDAVGLSDDGRFVVFTSRGSNLVAGGTTLNRNHVYRRNLDTGTTTLVSVASDGVAEGDGSSGAPSMTPDARLIAFASAASNLLAGADANGARTDIFVREMAGSTTQLVSMASSAGGADGHSSSPDISANGQFVAFSSEAFNLLPGIDPSRVVFIRDLIAGSTTTVPVAPASDTATRWSGQASLSGDGRFVAFIALRSPGTIGGAPGHFVHDRALHVTVAVAGASSGNSLAPQPTGPVMSRDGYEMLVDSETALVPTDTNGRMDVFWFLVPNHRDDVGVYRGSTGQWIVWRLFDGSLQTTDWGSPADNDEPVPADYDGDGRFDAAVYRPATGEWFVLNSSGGARAAQWGSSALQDQPVPADFDGDGRADIAVYRKTAGRWFILFSGGGSRIVDWGAPSLDDVPVPADYDGDGRADVAVYRRSTGEWFVAWATGNQPPIHWGAPDLGDIPVPADYDGDGATDFAFYRSSTGEWMIRRNEGGPTIVPFGSPSLGDVPVPANYDGLSGADVAIFRPSIGEWFIWVDELRKVTWGSDALGDVPITLPFALR